MTAATVFYWTTGKRAYARRRFLFPCFASGSAPPYCRLTRTCTPSFTRRRTKGSAPFAIPVLRQAQTASNTARSAGKEYKGGKPPNASGNNGKCHAVGAKKALYNAALRTRFYRGKGFIPFSQKSAFYGVT